MKKLALLFILVLAFYYQIDAQCVMCKATAESATESHERFVDGLNVGILYLMGIPYFLLATIGFIFFRKQIVEKIKSFKKA